jgi:hypothetical protein
VLVSGVWLAWLLRRWYNHVYRLEGALAQHSLDDLPRLQDTGEVELDRIVGALNQFSGRLRSSQQESRRLGRELAQAERLAALGRWQREWRTKFAIRLAQCASRRRTR